MIGRASLPYIFLTVALLTAAWVGWQYVPNPIWRGWTPAERALIQSLSLTSLPARPTAPGNAVADHPDAIVFGHRLFFDSRLSANRTIACASCHQPERFFTDGLPLASGLGQVPRHTMGLTAVAWSPWLLWDGRKDSLWSQALEPLENPLEHGSNRMALTRLISSDPGYRRTYEALFGELPEISDTGRFPQQASPVGNAQQQALWQSMHADDQHQVSQVFANIGKALAAYQRQLVPQRSRFDDYADALTADRTTAANSAGEPYLTRSERAGLRLFIGKAQCVNCHNGPLLTNNEFHNTGVFPAAGLLPERGRWLGARQVLEDPFNCLGPFSDAAADDCQELRFIQQGDETRGAHRTPSLRHVAETAPYMHAGQMERLEAVVRHYDRAQPSMLGHNETEPLQLRAVERQQLVAFLRSLSAAGPALPDAEETKWWRPPTDTP